MATVDDLLNDKGRKRIIEEIKSTENLERKALSFKECEVYNDRLHQYVVEELEEAFGTNAARKMPKISSVNLAKRVVKEESTIYKEKPRRTYLGASEDQQEKLDLIYKDMMANSKLMKSNEQFKLQGQSLVMVLPINGKLHLRVLKSHQYDTIPNPFNPEQADAYIISVFDREDYTENRKAETPSGVVGTSRQRANLNSDGRNQAIGDQDDYKAGLERYLVWTKDHNFIMDGKGNVLSDVADSPIKGTLPFIDIATNKEFEYFVRQGSVITDFAVQYNMGLSDLNHIVRMQGWSQAIIKGDKKLMVDDMTVGVTKVLFLPIDKNNPVETDFKFANPSPDLDGSIKFVEMLLANFLTSRGVDPKTVTGKADATSFTSGVERLLAMIDKFEASMEDYIVFEEAEKQLFELVRTWHNALLNKKELDKKYKTTIIDEDITSKVAFKKPEMIQTAQEKLDFYSQKIAMGMASTVDAVMDIDNMGREEALDELERIKDDEKLQFAKKDITVLPQGTNVQINKEIKEEGEPDNGEEEKTDNKEQEASEAGDS
jgi:hypothetical protein